MSDQVLRQLLNDVIRDIDNGRLRPLRPRRLRGALGGAMLAAAIGISTAGCGGRSVGITEDGGIHADAAQRDAAANQMDSGVVSAYAIPDVDSGTTTVLDSGPVDLYLAVGLDGGEIEALDGSVVDAEPTIPAYMAPAIPDDDPGDSD